MNPKIRTVGGLPITRKVTTLHTDLRKTFARVRRQMKANAAEAQEKVSKLPVTRAAGGRK